jgi:hemerythrin-like domain-containing protein
MQVLRNEHRVIEKVLDALERRLHSPIDMTFYQQSLDFLRNFADGCHHAKEEKELFPILESELDVCPLHQITRVFLHGRPIIDCPH